MLVEVFFSFFFILNIGVDFIFLCNCLGFVNEGMGENYGLEIMVEKFYSKNYYILIMVFIYDFCYIGSDGIECNIVFNNSYVLNVLVGKEW